MFSLRVFNLKLKSVRTSNPPELLDASSTSLGGSVLVNDLVTLILGTSTILQSSNQLFYYLKLSPEEGILLGVHGVSVHLEQVKIDSRNSLHKTFKGGIDLELLEEAGNDTAGGGSGEANLVIDNDRGVDVGAHKSLADGVEVHLIGGSGVADRHPDVGEARELLLGGLHDGTEGLHVSNLNLGLLLVDINHLQLLSVLLSTVIANL